MLKHIAKDNSVERSGDVLRKRLKNIEISLFNMLVGSSFACNSDTLLIIFNSINNTSFVVK